MTQEELKKVQKLQLMILKEIKRICEKYSIQYFLDAGTLLGAIRHEGFIPWDDDLDIGMERGEYEKFLLIADKELGESYFLQTQKSDRHYALPFAKVRLLGTKYVENKSRDSLAHNELFVDIFPYDKMPANIKQQKKVGYQLKLFFHLNLIKSGYRVWNGEGLLKKIKFFPIRVVALFCRKEKLQLKFETKIKQYNQDEKSQNVWIQDGISYAYWHFPIEYVHNLTMHTFEGEMFPIPAEYEKWLTQIYGDYRKLPPENKRGDYHQIIELDFGKYE